MNKPKLLNVREVADLLGVPVSWVYVHTGGKQEPVVPHFKLGKYLRFREDEINTWLGRQTDAAA